MHAHSLVVSKSVAAAARVTWTGGPPSDEDAHAVWDALTHRGLSHYAAVVEDVADALFRRDLACAGAVADVGFFQPFYRAYARAVLGRLAGAQVRIDEEAAP